MVSLEQVPEIRTELCIGGAVRSTDDPLQVPGPADGRSVVGSAAAASHPVGFPA
jgi:hypothetical protein